MKAQVEIRIWNDAEQPDRQELAELFEPHVEHVARQLSEGYVAGQIVGDDFTGWWEIVT